MKNWTHWVGEIHSRTVMDRRVERIAIAVANLPIPTCRILDVGAGNGVLAREIIKLRPDLQIQGIDTLLWPDVAIPIEIYDGKHLPWPDKYWDYCLASDVLHHCDDPLELMSEMVRVAKMGLIVKDHTANTRFDWWILRLMDWLGNIGHGVTLCYNYWDKSTWEQAQATLKLRPNTSVTNLSLYNPSISWLFDRQLHFVSLLDITKS